MPDWKPEIRQRLAGLRLAPLREAAIVEELAQHLEDCYAELLTNGVTEAEARRQTLAELSGSELLQRELRRVERQINQEPIILGTNWRRNMIAGLWQDLLFGARMLLKKPGFTAVTVLSLALGFALSATTMAVVNAYLIRSMPYPAANRLYHVIHAPVGQPEPRGSASLDWKTLSDVVEIADSSTLARFYVGEGAEKQEALGLSVAPGALEMLGVRTAIGRAFLDEDFRPGSEQVVLIGQALWRNRFGSDPNIVGRVLRASRSNLAEPIETFRIVGVLSSEFHYARDYARGPMEFAAPSRTPRQTYMVRLREGVPAAFAERRITEAVRSVASSFPPNWTGVHLESIHERYVTGLRPMLMAMTVAAGLVLIIVCVNVAVLMLLRALRRQKEMAVRVVLGAGRGHVVRMLVAEACLICGAALAVGLALTGFTLRLLAPIIEERLGQRAPGGSSAIALDATVLLTVGGVGLLIALTLSAIPLLTPWEKRLADTLRREGRSGTDAPAMRRFRSSLIALEVALSLALLAGCGLMIRSVVNLLRTDLGFQTEHIERSRVALPSRTYADAQTFNRFYERLNQQLSAFPDAPFALTNFIPFYEYPKQAVEVDGRDGNGSSASVMAVSDGYFALLGINLRQGRGFTAEDREGAEPVAVISETLARRLWPEGDAGSAVGQRIRAAEQPDRNVRAVWRTIVGVVRDARQTHVDVDLNDIYIPFFQAPSRYAPLYFRTDRPTSLSLDALRALCAEIDPDVLLTGGVTGEASLAREAERQLAGPRFLMSLLTGFALFAALLAIIGIYGVTAYGVRQREREIAIRVALGATPSAIVRMFLRQSGLVLAIGIGGGLFGAAAVARMLTNQLHGVQPFDAVTLLGACAFLAVAGLLATWWPARRAAAQNPLASLNEN
ncbi:MAG: ABC transporter permease [Blastocatellia bacterium]